MNCCLDMKRVRRRTKLYLLPSSNHHQPSKGQNQSITIFTILHFIIWSESHFYNYLWCRWGKDAVAASGESEWLTAEWRLLLNKCEFNGNPCFEIELDNLTQSALVAMADERGRQSHLGLKVSACLRSTVWCLKNANCVNLGELNGYWIRNFQIMFHNSRVFEGRTHSRLNLIVNWLKRVN